MKYTKPALVATSSAVAAIQAQELGFSDKSVHTFTDIPANGPGQNAYSAAAYQSDE